MPNNQLDPLQIINYFFALLAGVFVIMSLISFVTTDRSGSYYQARKMSIKRGFRFFILAVFSEGIAVGLYKPDSLETVIACTLGQLIIIGISYGIAYFQLSILGKSGVAKQIIEKQDRDRSEPKE